jgi:hypothetical protein
MELDDFKKMTQSERIISKVDELVDKPFVTAKFGDNWKEHTKRMLDEGQMDIDTIINIAWRQGRRNILLEDGLRFLDKIVKK